MEYDLRLHPKIKKDYQNRVLARYTGISDGRAFSVEKIARLRKRISDFPKEALLGVDCVVVCGSLARLEASQSSDVDLMVVSQASNFSRSEFDHSFNKLCKEIGLEAPNPKGVFAGHAVAEQLLKPAGNQDESYAHLSQRMLLLLESRYLYGREKYLKLRNGIIQVYGRDVETDKVKNYVFLLNDLIRYFRTICVNYQFNKEDSEEWGKWPIRNMKLRHSRVLMYFSLLAVLGKLSTYFESDKTELLTKLIEMTPLERIFYLYMEDSDYSWFRFFGTYDVFLRTINDKTLRSRLEKLEYDDRYKEPVFATLKSNSDGLAAEITRFILDRRRGSWSDRFFEYLLI